MILHDQVEMCTLKLIESYSHIKGYRISLHTFLCMLSLSGVCFHYIWL